MHNFALLAYLQAALTFDAAATAALVAAALALIFEYVPKLSDWYNARPDDIKRLYMALFLLVAVVALFVNDCRTDNACYSANWQNALLVYIEAIVVNQGVHRILPRNLFRAAREGFDTK